MVRTDGRDIRLRHALSRVVSGGSPEILANIFRRGRRKLSLWRSLSNPRSTFVSLLTVATFPAVAFLVVVHRTVLAGLFASRLVGGKSCRANHCCQNRKQNLSVILHEISFVRDVIRR